MLGARKIDRPKQYLLLIGDVQHRDQNIQRVISAKFLPEIPKPYKLPLPQLLLLPTVLIPELTLYLALNYLDGHLLVGLPA